MRTYPLQVYGAIMLVFDILVLFLCCRRGARKVSVPPHSLRLNPLSILAIAYAVTGIRSLSPETALHYAVISHHSRADQMPAVMLAAAILLYLLPGESTANTAADTAGA